MNNPACLVASALLLLGAGACDKDDVGTRCGTEVTLPSTHPIDGEEPVQEVVRIERDGDCESFQCLTHRGYEPYCTQPCSYASGSAGKACSTDADCGSSKSCHEGVCQTSDCPKGFVCHQVQEVGPHAGQLFCVSREGCGGKDINCGDLGRVSCDTVSCVDSCRVPPELGAEATECTEHRLTCVGPDALPCGCPQGSPTCTDAQLQCQGTDDAEPWPAGSVEQRTVCRLKNP